MFERFTDEARQVVVLAQEEARSLRHGYIGTEHLLMALMGEGEGVAAQVLASAGLTLADLRSDVRNLVGEGGAAPAGPGTGAGDLVEPSDADALRAIGIDVDSIRDRIEESFGPGALELPSRSPRLGRPRFGRTRPRPRPARHRRGAGCSGPTWPMGGHIPFTPRSKKVLELALREAIRLHDDAIGTGHILLGLVREGEGLAAEILVARGVGLADLRESVLIAIGKVA